MDVCLLAPHAAESVELEQASKDVCRTWINLATVSTDKHGRINYTMTPEETPSAVGIYPVIFLVK